MSKELKKEARIEMKAFEPRLSGWEIVLNGLIDKAYMAGQKNNPLYQEIFAEGESRGRRVERERTEKLIVKEITLANIEGEVTSRLTSLANKINEQEDE